MTDFRIDLKALRRTDKPARPADVARADQVGEKLGFVDREPKKPRGRKKSLRTGQVHAKVMPAVSVEIANEATRRGVVQGVIIEEAWQLYKAERI